MMFTSIAFDLDGTLIDSSQSILSSVRFALQDQGLSSAISLHPSMVGPSLFSLFSKLCPSISNIAIEQLLASFRSHYDSADCLLTSPFDGVDKMLRDLKRQDVDIYVVTNKRSLPTLKIVDHLGWGSLFSGIITSDLLGDPFPSKGCALEYFLLNFNLVHARTLYVGDRCDDMVAANDNSMPFIFAQWGYESSDVLNPEGCCPVLKVPSAEDIFSLYLSWLAR